MHALKKIIIPFIFLALNCEAQVKYYLHAQVGQPWGSTSNLTCMNSAFGVGAWTQAQYETVNVNALFQPSVCFIFMEGSDNNAVPLNNFLSANGVAMQNWVANGGKLYLNAAPNSGGNINIGFGGVILNYPSYTNTTTAYPGMAGMPQFSGPATPAGTNYSGNWYAHAYVSGGITVPVMTGTAGPTLVDKFWGLGRVMIGGASTTNWHTPAPNGTNVRTNLLTMLGGCCGAIPTITAVATPSSICAGQSVTITAGGAPGGSYVTFPGNIGGTTFVITPTVSTNFNIIGTPTTGCYGGVTIRVQVNANSPTLSVSGNTSICQGGTINLTASGANTYTWSTGSLSPSISQSPSTNTVYTVVGTASTGCTGTLTQAVSVNANPTVGIIGSQTVCSGSAIQLNATGANSFSWSNGSTSTMIVISPTANVTYSVTGTTSAGCTGTAVTNITVSPSPGLSITGGTAAICPGASVLLTANGANSYSWSNGAFTSTISPSPSVTTTYSVIGSGTNACTGNAMITITVSPGPSLSVSGGTAVCSGQNTTLTASGANTYTWNNGPITSSIAVSPPVNTTYTVNGTNTVTGCSGSTVASVIVNPTPSLAINGGNAVCSGNSATLTASGANTYSWSNGSLTSSTAVSPSVSTTYSVIGTNSAGCTGMATVMVNVGTTPTVSISGNAAVCQGQTVNLIASGANSYLWNNGSFSAGIIVSPSVTTGYTATGIGQGGCTGTAAVIVTVNPLPVVQVSGPGTVCIGSPATLVASGASSYTWSFGPNSNSVVVSPSVTTTYSVAGTSGAGCTGNTSTVSVAVVFCTGLHNNHAGSQIRVYPNPVSSVLGIESDEIVSEIKIYDLTGRRVYNAKAGELNMKLNVADLSPGVYFLKMNTGTGEKVFRIIKE
jgi:hypothetical protein